jgi:CRISPR-associated protein Cas2
MTRAVRERIWWVLDDWHFELGTGGIVMTWRDSSLPGGQGVSMLGIPPKDLQDADGILLARRDLLPGIETQLEEESAL